MSKYSNTWLAGWLAVQCVIESMAVCAPLFFALTELTFGRAIAIDLLNKIELAN